MFIGFENRAPLLVLLALLLGGCAKAPRLDGAATELLPEVASSALLPTAADDEAADGEAEATAVRPRAAGGSLSASERQTLLHLSEQEKLARDLYESLSETWRLDVFHTTSGSEDIHADALRTLLGRYKLFDPSQGLGRGEFSRVDLAERYGDLIARGRFSPVEALKAAASVEELEIEDMSRRLLDVQVPEIQSVLETVVSSDKHHLRSLVVALRKLGHAYQPTRLPRDQYDLILDEQAFNQ
jgi:hypothetical protein